MMPTAFAQIVSAIIDALKAAPPVCPVIDRARSTLIAEQLDKAVSVQWDAAQPEAGTISGAPMDWQTRISVEVFASSVKEPGDLAVDGLLSAVAERLGRDTTLGGLIADLRITGLVAENDSKGKKTGWVRLTYIADHRTSNGILN